MLLLLVLLLLWLLLLLFPEITYFIAPYGVRAGARKVGWKKGEEKQIVDDIEKHEGCVCSIFTLSLCFRDILIC
jgi:hypothetical protein